MKRIALLLLVLCLLLGACANTNAGAPPASAPAQTQDAAGTTETPAAPVQGGFSADDLKLSIDGQVFELKTDIAPLLAKLGDGYTLTEATSCLYDGMDKTFEYPGVSVYTFPTDGVDYIDEIVLTDGTYATPKGVAVGDALEDVVAAYGDDYYDDNGVIVYSTGSDPADLKSPRLYFTMEDGAVTLIGFYSASNIQ